MKVTTIFKAASLLSSFFASSVSAQQAAYTHPGTGITFYKQTIPEAGNGGLEWGMALPGAPTGDNDEYIGYLVRVTSAGSTRMLTLSRKVICGLASRDIQV